MKRADTLQFDFMVQVRSGGDDMGIEDASSGWDEAAHQFVRVATITIAAAQDDVDADERKAECEALAFSPWHSLAAHQPIGSINRLRLAVYEAAAEHRLKQRHHDHDHGGERAG
jgi:hypothetical protein